MATVDSVAMLALAVAAVVGSLLVRSRRHHQARVAEHDARFAPLVDLFGGAGRPGALVRDTYRGRAYLVRRVRSQPAPDGPVEPAAPDRRVVVEIEMPSFGRSPWRIVRRAGACGTPSMLPVPAGTAGTDNGTDDGAGELVADDAELRRVLADGGAVGLVAGLGDDDLTVGYEPRRQRVIYRERADRASLANVPALRRRLDTVFELATLNESAQRI
ncbi:MAG: hypothetical protein OEY70_13620 [Acidimicrobiia bacterium]|nr:hypothetical protein [Acidimicrobiia bacterium]